MVDCFLHETNQCSCMNTRRQVPICRPALVRGLHGSDNLRATRAAWQPQVQQNTSPRISPRLCSLWTTCPSALRSVMDRVTWSISALSCMRPTCVIADYGLLAWFEHMDSSVNPADGGSRLGVLDLVASPMGVTLQEGHLPPWPSSVRFAPASAWLHMLGARE